MKIHPYLNFDGNTEEAFNFYKSVFGGEFQLVRFKDLGDNMGASGEDLNMIANIALPLSGNTTLMGNDVLESMGPSLTVGNNFYILLEVESTEEGERLFNALSAGGEVKLPLQKTEWAEQYGMCTDKFGVQWMFNYSPDQ